MTPSMSPTNIFSPAAQPARWLAELSHLVLGVSAAIFAVVVVLLCYCIWKYRRRTAADDWREPPQVYGSTQIELAWTIIPVLIVLVLFLTTARVIAAIQERRRATRDEFEVDRDRPPVLVGVPVPGPRSRDRQRAPRPGERSGQTPLPPCSGCSRRTPTTASGFRGWPGRPTSSPTTRTRCGSSRASPGSTSASARSTAAPSTPRCCSASTSTLREDFDRWVRGPEPAGRRSQPRRPGGRAASSSAPPASTATPSPGPPANGRFGPDLTHLMSRDTLARRESAPNTPEEPPPVDPEPGRHQARVADAADGRSTRPSSDAVTAYLLTLR